MKNKIPSFAVTGKKDSGKTTVVERLIKELVEKGYKVASVKHTRGDHSMDRSDTDTWRHGRSGAGLVVFSSPIETTLKINKRHDASSILELVNRLGEYDVVIIEGMKDEDLPSLDTSKIEESDSDEILEKVQDDIELSILLNKLPNKNCGRCGYETCDEFARDVIKGLKKVEECVERADDSLIIEIDGKKIELSRFPSRILKGGISGMLNSLKDVDDPKDVHILMKLED